MSNVSLCMNMRAAALIATLCLLGTPCWAAEAPSFAGYWASCDEPECLAYEIHQKGSRVCGHWSYIATRRQYSGRFIASTDRNHLLWTEVCGIPGGLAMSYCPVPSDFDPGIPTPPSNIGWHSSDQVQTLCSGELLDGLAQCVSGSKTPSISALHRVPPPPTRYRIADSEVERQWVRACLNEA